MTAQFTRVFAAVGIVLVACQAPSGPATIDCGPLSDPECERAVERAQRELGDDWPHMERIVFVENGWDAVTWGGEWKAFRTGDP
jgi:hypothetical protein